MKEEKAEVREKPNLPWMQIFNMSVGFFGIQHGFEIQFARMSSIYEKLGADPHQIPLLWLAAPMTGLIVQPIIGYMSDRTWIGALKMRRRPYFLFGAIFATIALFLMPDASALWMAAGLLWILDASLNISMEPFRAFVADKLNTRQRSLGFAMQSLMIGLGTIAGNGIASLDFLKIAPWMRSFASTSMHVSFYLCAIIFLAAVVYTVVTTPEYPPDKPLEKSGGSLKEALKNWLGETVACYREMPPVMTRLAWVQFLTWMGLFCMWMYYTVAVARSVFGAADPNSALYDEGVRWGAHTMMVKGFATPLFALMIPLLVRKIGAVKSHAFNLLLCGAGLMTVPFITEPKMLYLPMIAAGIGWASITALPYVILVDHIPSDKYGIYMGIFNMFIVLPEILVAVGLGGFMLKFMGNNQAMVVGLGGVLIVAASALTVLLLRNFEKHTA